MPISLAKLVANRASATIDFGGGDVLHVDYYPARLTSKMLQAVSQADRLKDLPEDRVLEVLGSATDTLLALLAGWDLTAPDEVSDERGPDGPDRTEIVLPIDRATIEALGISLQWAILNGILRSAASASTSGEAQAPAASVSAPSSGAGSSPTAA